MSKSSIVITIYIIGIIIGFISYELYKSQFEEEFNKLKEKKIL